MAYLHRTGIFEEQIDYWCGEKTDILDCGAPGDWQPARESAMNLKIGAGLKGAQSFKAPENHEEKLLWEREVFPQQTIAFEGHSGIRQQRVIRREAARTRDRGFN